MNYSVFSSLFSLKLRILFEEGTLGKPVQKDAVPPWSYRIAIDENTIPQKRICVLSYLCLLLTKVLFETYTVQVVSIQYQRQTSIKLFNQIDCVFTLSLRYKGLCHNKKHGFDQYTKGGHFCAALMALSSSYCCSHFNDITGP